MANKLIFLGTGGDSLALAKQRRGGGGFILQLEGGQYHIDPGPGALANAGAAKVSPRETIAVVVSNNSLYTSEGVNAVIDAMTLGGVDRFGVVVCARSIKDGVADQNGHERPVLRESCRRWVERVVTFEETTRIGVNYLNIFPREARGPDLSGLGFRFETPTLTIGYTGDTGYWEGLPKQHQECDILIIRCKLPKGARENGAMNVDDIINLLDKAKPRVAFLTGMGAKLLDSDIIALAREIQRETKVQTIAAKDGLEVDLDQYAGKAKQTTIKGWKK